MGDRITCPKCGSDNITMEPLMFTCNINDCKSYTTPDNAALKQYQCKETLCWHTWKEGILADKL